MQKELSNRLEKIPNEFNPIKEFVERYSQRESRIDKLGTLQLVKNPEFLDAYFICSFAPAIETYFSNFESRYNFKIPKPLDKFLRFSNGFYFCDFTIYGLTPSIYKSEIGLLERSVLQPLDIGAANDTWNKEYGQAGFHFGGRYYDDEKNCGYFLKDEIIVSCLIDGEIVGTWTSFSDFLSDELTATEKTETGLNNR